MSRRTFVFYWTDTPDENEQPHDPNAPQNQEVDRAGDEASLTIKTIVLLLSSVEQPHDPPGARKNQIDLADCASPEIVQSQLVSTKSIEQTANAMVHLLPMPMWEKN